MAFKEPVYKILECIKNEPYFWWLRKMGEDLAKKKSKFILHVSQGKKSYYRIMSGVERSSRTTCKGRTFERIYNWTRRWNCGTSFR